jgi:flagellar hook-associated protein 1 FlgK
MVVRAAGTTLVEGNKASSLEVTTDATGAMKLLARPQGGAPTDVTAQLSGGSLAGLREVRDVDAPAVLGRLDALAYDIASAINAQHAAGVGLDGVGGRPLFAVSAPPDSARTLAVHPDMVGRPDRVAAASAAGMLPAGSDNAMAMARLSEARVAAGGTKSPAEAYADIVGDIGLRKASAAQEADVRDAMRAQASVLRESTRGVSIDEEMIALTRYQRAYEAASKLVKTADELLAGLIRDL